MEGGGCLVALLGAILILISWAVIAIKEKITPSKPPIDNTTEHMKTIMNLPDAKARRKYLKRR